MKNVMFIVPSLRRAGAETQVVDLVNNIDPSRYRVHLVSFSPCQDQLARIDNDRVEYHHVLRESKYATGYLAKIARLIDDNRIELIHCTLQFSLLVAWLSSKLSRRKPLLITVLHTTINRGLKEEMHDRLLYQWLMRRCGKIVFVCENQRSFWVSKYRFLRRTSVVIHNGVDSGYFDPDDWRQAGESLRDELGIPSTACLFACVAGFRREKGHRILLEAFMETEGDNVLVLAGDGPERAEVERFIETRQLGGKVHLLGMVEEIRPVLSAADVSVLASTAVETFSIAMLESMSMATPMIASDLGGMSEAIEHDATGWLVEPGNGRRLAATMSAASLDRENRLRVGRNARQTVLERFSLEKMARDTEKMLDAQPGDRS